MHSFAIAHRDLKLENIMMVNDTDTSELKLVDFGLSKILGPTETSTEPFGTLVTFNPVLNFEFSLMWPQRCFFKSLMGRMWICGAWESLSM